MNNADRSWAMSAACAHSEPDRLFVRGAAQRQAREVCFNCPVRLACLAEALNSETEFGVWGGMTERERRALLRRFPEVTDWNGWLAEKGSELRPARPARPAAKTAATSVAVAG